MKQLKLLLLGVLFLPLAQAQQPGQLFSGGSKAEVISDMAKATDGSIYAVGAKKVTPNRYQVWLQKLNAAADQVLWEKTYAFSTLGISEFGCHLAFTADGGLLITGRSQVDSIYPEIGNRGLVLKTDLDGNQQWKKVFTDLGGLLAGMPKPGGGYYLAGGSSTTAVSDGLLACMDETGNILWQKSYANLYYTTLHHIFPSDNGNLVLVGRTEDTGIGLQGVILIKTAANGAEIWRKQYDTEFNTFNFRQQSFYHPLAAAQLSDGGFIIANPKSYYTDIDLTRLDAQGNLLWEKVYGGNKKEIPLSIFVQPDHSVVISGYTSAPGVTDKAFAMRVLETGYEMWRKEYGKTSTQERFAVGLPLSNDVFLFAGISNDPAGAGGYDGWLVRTDDHGNLARWTINGSILYDLNGNCQVDAGEPPAPGILITASGASTESAFSDPDGSFTLYAFDGLTDIQAQLPDIQWEICSNPATAVTNAGQPAANVTFLLKPKDACEHLEVNITQPDLNRCREARYFVTVRNNGNDASGTHILRVAFDPSVEIVSAENGAISFNTVSFGLEHLEPSASETFEIIVVIPCDVQLGAVLPAKAAILGNSFCTPWQGPYLDIISGCSGGSEVYFTITNSGAAMAAPTHYRIFSNNVLYSEATLQLMHADLQQISFPSLGKTWRLEIDPPAGYFQWGKISAIQEGCDVEPNGQHSVGFGNAWRYDDSRPFVSYAASEISTGEPDKVAEGTTGFGLQQWIADSNWVEFTARINNPLPDAANKVEFVLTPTANLEVRSFRILASNRPVAIAYDNNGRIHLTMDSLDLLPVNTDLARAGAYARFGLQPVAGTQPGLGQDSSIFGITAVAYLDEKGPYVLHSGWNEFKKGFMAPENPLMSYPAGILTYGGRGYDFSGKMALAPDGTIFAASTSSSYDGRFLFDGIVYHMTAQGKVIWQQALAIDPEQIEHFLPILPLSDGGCIAAGSVQPRTSPGYLNDYDVLIARFSASGNVLWYKRLRPGENNGGGWATSLAATQDGNFVIGGYCQNSGTGTDNFLIKIDLSGQIIWSQNYIVNGIAFVAEDIHPLPSGAFLLAGYDKSNNHHSVYLQKVAADGSTLWTQFYDSDKTFTYGGSALAPNGDLMVAGYSQWVDPGIGQYVTTPHFFRFTAEGVFLWEKIHQIPPFYSGKANAIRAGLNGDFICAGETYTDTTAHFFQMLFLRLNDAGDILSQQNFGSASTEEASDLEVLPDGQVLLWGNNQPRLPDYNTQCLLVRTDTLGSLSVRTHEPESPWYAVSLSPNPAQSVTEVHILPEIPGIYTWQLCTLSGQVVGQSTSTGASFRVSVESLPAGLYFLQIRTPEGIGICRKIIVSK